MAFTVFQSSWKRRATSATVITLHSSWTQRASLLVTRCQGSTSSSSSTTTPSQVGQKTLRHVYRSQTRAEAKSRSRTARVCRECTRGAGEAHW